MIPIRSEALELVRCLDLSIVLPLVSVVHTAREIEKLGK